MQENYDIIIIGSGPGGIACAMEARKYGASILIIEKQHNKEYEVLAGGTCLFRGCIPTKTMMHSSKTKGMNWKKLSKEVDEVVNVLSDSSFKQLNSIKDIDFVAGVARVMSDSKVLVVGENDSMMTFNAENIVLATGSIPLVPIDWHGRDNCELLTSDSILEKEKLNDDIIIVGGGYIGCEYATILSNLGKKVTIIEATKTILPTEDKDCIREVMKAFKIKGVEVRLETSFNPKEKKWKGKQVLIAIGRKPNTNVLDNKDLININGNGQIVVNEFLMTNNPSIYAIGDLIDRPFRLAHVAAQEGRIAARNIMKSQLSKQDKKNKKLSMKYNAIPSTVFTNPLIMSVGKREHELKSQKLKENKDYIIGREWMKANGFSSCVKDSCGFFKVLVEKKTGKILGASFVAGIENKIDIHEIVLAIEKGLTVYDIAEMSHFHPSSIEAIRDGCLNAIKNN